jgi:predicted flap endonuclease-1-like 5' DNA nuclease
MNDLLAENWPLLLLGAIVVMLLLWWLLIANRKTRVNVDRRDTLDEGAAPAARNQALIDAPAAAQEARIEAEADADDLTRIKGLGPKLAATLGGLGVTRFDQIAGWTDADIDRIDAQLGRFQGRIRRDDWVEQARLLAADDTAGFASRFGAT